MFNKATIRLMAAALAIPAGMLAQDAPISSSSIHIDLGKDSPVVLVDSATGESRATATGSALVIDLHMSLSLRNTGSKRIHSLKLGVVAQEVAVGGKGSVAQPGMNVAPGETFPVPIDLQLMKPAQAAGPLVEVKAGWRAVRRSFLLRPGLECATHANGLGD